MVSEHHGGGEISGVVRFISVEMYGRGSSYPDGPESREKVTGRRGQIGPSKVHPSDLLPPAKPHFPKVPQSSKIVLPAGNKCSKDELMEDISDYNNHMEDEKV